MSKDGELSKEEKIQMICGLLRQAPPNEFHHVFEDLRFLVMDDQLMRTEAAQECAFHNKKNFKAVKLLGGNSLVTHYNDLRGNRFFDPQRTFSFRYDHLSGRTDKFLLQGTMGDDAELWRSTLNGALKTYTKKHFPIGTCCVFRKALKSSSYFVVCIEGHQYQPSESFNGLWTSEWTFACTPPSTEVTGNYHLQIHYFKKANWQATVDKTVEKSVPLINRVQFATALTKFIEAEDNEFQIALEENLQELSVDLWKTLRRRIPVTRTVISWDKLLSGENTKRWRHFLCNRQRFWICRQRLYDLESKTTSRHLTFITRRYLTALNYKKDTPERIRKALKDQFKRNPIGITADQIVEIRSLEKMAANQLISWS